MCAILFIYLLIILNEQNASWYKKFVHVWYINTYNKYVCVNNITI